MRRRNGIQLGFGRPDIFAIFILSAILTIVVAPDSARAQTSRLEGNHPAAAAEFRALSHANAVMPLQMQVTLALRNRSDLESLLAEQQDPTSPNYHKWLTPDEFGQRFGPDPAGAQVVSDWLTSAGFTVTSVDLKSRSIKFIGTVADAERVFTTTISKFGDGSTYANTSDPQIPSQFVGIIGAIDGLDNMRRAIPASHSIAPNSSAMPIEGIQKPLELATNLDLSSRLPALPSVARPDVTIGSTTAFAPSDLYTFYDENPLLKGGVNGSGGLCIAIVGTSDFSTAAVSFFNSFFRLPDNSASITRVFPAGNPGTNGAEIEALADLEWSHVVAPSAGQVFYATQNLTGAISQAVNDNACGAINISFSICAASSTFFTGVLDPLFAQAASQGQSVFISSDDFGAAGGVAQMTTCVAGTSRGVSEMAASPNVTAVGGTQFVPNYDGSGNDIGFTSENVWNDSGGASGGGASALFPKPSYQAGPGVPADGARDVPDVAMIAGFPGVFVGTESNGSVGIGCCFGGTSLSAPIWAGINRLASQISGRQGNMNPRIYQLAAAGTGRFRDITSGSNGFNGVPGFPAIAGYDQATGWGTVDISRFVNSFVAPFAGFANVPGLASDIGVGADGTVWVTHPSQGIYRFNGNGFDHIPGAAVRVAVGPDGNAWVVGSNGSIYRYTGTAWIGVPGIASDIGVGADGTVWVVNSFGNIYRTVDLGANWQNIPGAAVRVAVDPRGNAWVVASNGSIWRYTGTAWVNVPGIATDIGVGADGTVWVVNSSNLIYRYDGTNFQNVPGLASAVSVDPIGQAWVVNGAGFIYRASGF
jgi:pseudomonalisin